jgi:hypothetical protein
MKFVIAGVWPYLVGIASEPIVEGGRAKMGRYLEREKRVEISPDCPANYRLTMAVHELVHGWIVHNGSRPRGTEGLCDFVATVTVSTIRWLNANGGETALLRLQPGEVLQLGAARIHLTRNRWCALCQETVAGGSVDCRPAEDVAGVAELTLYCPFCNHVQRWRETMTTGGMPSGMVVGEPSFERDHAKVAAFVKAAPGASDVRMNE